MSKPHIKPRTKYCHDLSDHPDSQCQRLCKPFNEDQYKFCVESSKSDSLRSTGQSGDGSGGGEEEADEDCPSGRLLGNSPKIHGGKVEDLDPELQSILKHRKRS